MRIGKPLMIGTTTLGIGLGLYEGYHFAGGLVVLMMALMGVIGVAIGSIVATVRRERREEEEAARRAAAAGPEAGQLDNTSGAAGGGQK
jgi:predicted Na+-dependent transporter